MQSDLQKGIATVAIGIGSLILGYTFEGEYKPAVTSLGIFLISEVVYLAIADIGAK